MKGHGQKFTRKMHHAVIALLQSPTVEGAAGLCGGLRIHSVALDQTVGLSGCLHAGAERVSSTVALLVADRVD